AGNPIGFNVTLNNQGRGQATGLVFADDLPAGGGVDWSVDAANSDPAWSVTGSPPNQQLVYGSDTLDGHASAHVHVVSGTTADSCGSYDNTASFTTGNDGSGEDSASTSVDFITVSKTADAESVLAGEPIGYTVPLSDIGSVTATARRRCLPAGRLRTRRAECRCG